MAIRNRKPSNGQLVLIVVASILILAGSIFVLQAPRNDSQAQSRVPDQVNATGADPVVESDLATNESSQTAVTDKLAVSTNTSREMFRELDPHEIEKIAPIIQELYFLNGEPQLYSRHKVVAIDLAALRHTLESQWFDRESNAAPNSLAFPLFDDQLVDIEVRSLRRGHDGTVSVYGKTHSAGGTRAASFNFIKDGGLLAGLETMDMRYTIAPVSEETYFIVIEQHHIGSID